MNLSKTVTSVVKTVSKAAIIITTIITIGDNIQQLKELIKNDN